MRKPAPTIATSKKSFAALPADPLVAGLVGAGAGAAVGGLIGALVGATGVHHEAVVVKGHDPGLTLVGVTAPHNMAKSAEELLQIAGACKVTRD